MIINGMGKLMIILFFSFLVLVPGKKGFGSTDQEWGYVTVRKDAHMFWWLYYTTANVTDYTDKPLIVWLQGGPGASSTGYDVLREQFPVNTLEEFHKVKHANVLFVDNPVGTGYSYVENDAYTRTNKEIAQDFLELMKAFYKYFPKFQLAPLYIFSESYGGKMTADIALLLHKESNAGNITCRLKGIGLGDSWISPLDSILTWAPYLLSIGAIDEKGEQAINKVASRVVSAYAKGNFKQATNLFFDIEEEVYAQAYGVDFYNVIKRIPSGRNNTARASILEGRLQASLDDLMNGAVKKALNISQVWVEQSHDVFAALSNDFMKPAITAVEELLNSTDIQVAVYNGQLDLIVDTPGTVNWVDKMIWKDKEAWSSSERRAFSVDGYYEGYVKKHNNFAFYWVNRAGHMVPSDNSNAMYHILKSVTENFKV